ncbi:UNKNOWN [Stylonychia lemnae]|uniref:Uncharacterized protein n=1 Tax=Stylonychia lemnae TaxID=5949 RepID=A0A078ALX3_STYLE|nr:UNKNOWN [Stylonychia lemnae]|eukprot:CDW82387.1 UNKNOWN [Stylonychia lemnae]
MEHRSSLRQSQISQFFQRDDENTIEDIEESKAIDSQESEEDFESPEYITTNLLFERNLTLADIEVDTINYKDMDYLFFDIVEELDNYDFEGFIIDPRLVVKEQQKIKTVQTLLTDEQIMNLARQVLELYTKYRQSDLEPQGRFVQNIDLDLPRLEQRVIENH